MMMDDISIFKTVKNDDGENWAIAYLGTDENGDNWSVNTDHVHASELHQYSRGPQRDAELIVALLNGYYTSLIRFGPQDEHSGDLP